MMQELLIVENQQHHEEDTIYHAETEHDER
jgi:hypothetical protein